MMTVQNGIGSEEVVQRHGDWPIVSGVTFMSGTRHSDTHVEYELDTPTWLGPFAGTRHAADARRRGRGADPLRRARGGGPARPAARPSGRS